MKKSVGLLVGTISTLFLMGCPGSSGGGGGNAGAMQLIAVTNNNPTIFQYTQESCSSIGGNIDSGSYQCTQLINGSIQASTQVNTFMNRQEFCYKITNQQFNLDVTTQQPIAINYRALISSQYCGGISGTWPTNPTNPTNPTLPGMDGIKTFTCQLQARKGNAVYQGELQQLLLSRYQPTGTLSAFTQVPKCNWLGCIYLPSTLAKVKVRYDAALAGSSSALDRLTLSVEDLDHDTKVSVSGFAGSETKIEVTPEDSESDRTTLVAICRGADSFVRPQIPSNGLYQCKGEERLRGTKRPFDYTNQLSDVINSGISVTNSVFVQGSVSDEVNVSQTLMRAYDDSTVNLKSNLSSASSIRIEKTNSSYSLKLDCQPK